MTVYRATSARYADMFDMLYVLCGPNGSLTTCYSVEDTPSGITVMYAKDGSVVGVEVPDFMEHYGVPATVAVDARKPFKLQVDCLEEAALV